jgi:hypothetical protein
MIDSRLRSLDFLRSVASAWFGETLESISRARLITDPAVRTSVELAERAATDDDYSTAAKHLAVAFETARCGTRLRGIRRSEQTPPQRD